MFFVSCYCFFCLKYFIWYKYNHSCFLLVFICMEYLFHPFTLSLCVSLDQKWVSCRPVVYNWVFFFLIHPSTLCFLIGEFNLFTFRVIIDMCRLSKDFPGGSAIKNPPAMQEMQVWSLGCEDPLKEDMATYSSFLAWRIPWTEEPGGPQSTGLIRRSPENQLLRWRSRQGAILPQSIWS